MYVFSALQLNSSGACNGVFVISPSSTITATTETSNFMELAIPAQTSSSGPCAVDLNSEISAALANGTTANGTCPADLDGDGRCTVIDIQRVLDY